MKKTIFLTSIILATALVGCNGKYGSRIEAKTASEEYLARGQTYKYKQDDTDLEYIPLTNVEKQLKSLAEFNVQECMKTFKPQRIAAFECGGKYSDSDLRAKPFFENVITDKTLFARECFEEDETKQFVCSDAEKPKDRSIEDKNKAFVFNKNYRYFRY